MSAVTKETGGLADQLQQQRRTVDFDTYDITVRQLLSMLKEGAIATPFNLDTLVIWTLLQGLLSQEDQSETGDLCRMLHDDLLTGLMEGRAK